MLKRILIVIALAALTAVGIQAGGKSDGNGAGGNVTFTGAGS